MNETNFSGIELTCNQFKYLLINIYLPCDNRSLNNFIAFKDILASLSAALDIKNALEVVIAGDTNSQRGRGNYWSELSDFVEHYNFSFADILQLPADSHTFLSAVHNTGTWIDHVMVSDTCSISDIRIEYEKCIFDHFPLSFQLDFLPDIDASSNCDKEKSFIDWNKINSNDIEKYHTLLSGRVNDLINYEVLKCSHKCQSSVHREKLDQLYSNILSAILECSSNFNTCADMRAKEVPGWNTHVKEAHEIARYWVLEWFKIGKPRHGWIFEYMKITRNKFQQKLKFCKRNEQMIRDDKLYDSFKGKNFKKFWRDVRKIKGSETVLPSIVDTCNNNVDISNHFHDKFAMTVNDKSC